MEFVLILLLVAIVFGICYLIDKAFTKLFRSRIEHMSGLSIRLPKRYGSLGLIIIVLGLMALFVGISQNILLAIGGIVVMLIGIGSVVYYLSTGIFYDKDSFLYSSFGKKSRSYRYSEIRQQKLYVLQGGALIVELHMTDGTALSVLSQMPNYDQFLDHAFDRWCHQRGIIPENCDFHNPGESCWFPSVEVE